MRHVQHLPTGIFEVVTAVAWDEWEGIVMVTIVLVGACVCDTDPEKRVKKKSLTAVSLYTVQTLKTLGKFLGKDKEFSSEGEKCKAIASFLPGALTEGSLTYQLWLLKEACWLPE